MRVTSFIKRIQSRMQKQQQGSLTVEACIALPVFLCFFFLLLFFVKIACLNIEIDHAVKETARQLASSSYLINYVNDYLDNKAGEGDGSEDFFTKEKAKIKNYTEKELKESLVSAMMTGKFTKPDLEKQMGKMGDIIETDLEKGLEKMIFQQLLPSVLELKGQLQYKLVRQIMDEYLSRGNLNPERLRLSLVELPQAAGEYRQKKEKNQYQGTGLEPDRDFDRGDIVLQAEYTFNVPLPFFGQRELVLRHTAVEKAWLKGTNGIYSAAKGKEKINLEELIKDPKGNTKKNTLVYVCKSNTPVYHSRQDCDYLGSQIIIMTLEEAEAQGKRVHGGCPHRFK